MNAPYLDQPVLCSGCGCNVDESVGVGRECECSRAGRSDDVLCIGCCVTSLAPCVDALHDYRSVRRAS